MTTQTYAVHVRATPEAIWDAITKSEWTHQYGYRGGVEYELRPGGAARGLANEDMKAMGAPDVIVDGEVVEADRPRKLVQTWRLLMEEEIASEPFSRVKWEIQPPDEEDPMRALSGTKLTVTHELDGAPATATIVSGAIPGAGGGWPFILSDPKTLLETGKPLAG